MARVVPAALAAVIAWLATGCVAGRHVAHLGGQAPARIDAVPVVSSPAPSRAGHAQVVTWNVHKSDHPSFRREVAQLMDGLAATGGPVALCLQEARCDTFECLHAHRQGEKELSGHYAPSWSFPWARRSTGVLTVANREVPAGAAESLLSPSREFGMTSPKVSLRSELTLDDGTVVQVVNCHALNFVRGPAFARQIEGVFAPLRGNDVPAIVCGDFNVWSASRLETLRAIAAEAGLVEVESREPGRSAAPRWLGGLGAVSGFDPSIVLDRVFARGVEVIDCFFVAGVTSSDHQPLVVRFRAASPGGEAPLP